MTKRIPPPAARITDPKTGLCDQYWYDFFLDLTDRPSKVSNLPLASIAGAGARGFVTDSTVTLAAGLGNIVVGGGVNATPVYSDNVNWRIG